MSDHELNEPQQDPSESEDGTEPMTADQRAQLESLGGGDSAPDREISRAEAAQLIDSLSHRTERDVD